MFFQCSSFFIAALITFSTMTRMVEENRREIGILKALGYKKGTIAQKYILYASLATFFGILLGTSGWNELFTLYYQSYF